MPYIISVFMHRIHFEHLSMLETIKKNRGRSFLHCWVYISFWVWFSNLVFCHRFTFNDLARKITHEVSTTGGEILGWIFTISSSIWHNIITGVKCLYCDRIWFSARYENTLLYILLKNNPGSKLWVLPALNVQLHVQLSNMCHPRKALFRDTLL